MNSDARDLLSDIQTVLWIWPDGMTIQEKELHPEHETTEGFLRKIHLVEAADNWWNRLSARNKDKIKAIPNFDSDKFYKITGIKI